MLFITGIFSMAFGISLLIKSSLGTSPISSIPYILTEQSLYSIGTTTMLVNLLFLLAQIGLLGRKFEPFQLMQVPITFIFAIFLCRFYYKLCCELHYIATACTVTLPSFMTTLKETFLTVPDCFNSLARCNIDF